MDVRDENMGLPACEQRVLSQMENALAASEPQLAAMFAIFARLNAGEPVGAESLGRGGRRGRGGRGGGYGGRAGGRVVGRAGGLGGRGGELGGRGGGLGGYGGLLGHGMLRRGPAMYAMMLVPALFAMIVIGALLSGSARGITACGSGGGASAARGLMMVSRVPCLAHKNAQVMTPGTAAPGTAAPGTAAPGTAAPGTAAARSARGDAVLGEAVRSCVPRVRNAALKAPSEYVMGAC